MIDFFFKSCGLDPLSTYIRDRCGHDRIGSWIYNYLCN